MHAYPHTLHLLFNGRVQGGFQQEDVVGSDQRQTRSSNTVR
jgi:hypothetical protein